MYNLEVLKRIIGNDIVEILDDQYDNIIRVTTRMPDPNGNMLIKMFEISNSDYINELNK